MLVYLPNAVDGETEKMCAPVALTELCEDALENDFCGRCGSECGGRNYCVEKTH